MSQAKQYIAVDLGAESGRVMLGDISDKKISLKECHRFPNVSAEEDGALRWNFQRLTEEIKTGISKAVERSNLPIGGISVDSWGVDFGLLDVHGQLLENPYHYRDKLMDGILDKAFELMPKREIYEHTGIQFMQINSAYQLLAMRLAETKSLSRAKHLVMIADLVEYYLCGKIFTEYSLGSTSQLMNMATGQWDDTVFNKLKLPREIMPKIVPTGSVVGTLKSKLAAELGCGAVPVIAAGSHDTACAVVAVPATGNDWAYLSSGTWGLMGLEVPDAIINDKTFEYQFTNEGGACGKIRLLKNIIGLWPVQECRRQWRQEGEELSYTELTKMAAAAKPFAGRIDPDYHEFLSPGDMPGKIKRYLKRTGQKSFDDKGQLIRIVLESLAFKCRAVMDMMEDIKQKPIEVLHIVGGGIQNELLCQFTANAIGKKVIAGPVEATASGSIIMQAIATGQIDSLQQGRQIIRDSYSLSEYEPRDKDLWDKEYKKSL